jgi:methylthioribose-1-phosphate isomerase
MKVAGEYRRTIWPTADGTAVEIIDQVRLPHRFEVLRLATLDDAAKAIRDMHVRGAPLIGVAAAYGLALALREEASEAALAHAGRTLVATRPTAVNLRWAIETTKAHLTQHPRSAWFEAAYAFAGILAEEDVAICRAMGRHGLPALKALAAARRDRPLNILTHCNAGWLAAVDWGTATAPIYTAQETGLPIHVFVDETRPRNQGAALTAWELREQGVPHTVIADNTGGHLMQHGMIDCVIVGTDRTTARGDVCNKIGTYLKALAAKANDVPFYVAAPSPSIDFEIEDGLADIPIEERSSQEVTHLSGRADNGEIVRIQITPDGSPALNYAFDVTPASLVTGLITERGLIDATAGALAATFPERAKHTAAA